MTAIVAGDSMAGGGCCRIAGVVGGSVERRDVTPRDINPLADGTPRVGIYIGTKPLFQKLLTSRQMCDAPQRGLE